MNASHTTTVQANKPSSEENKPGFRTKTIATRLTPEELAEVEFAAGQAGKALSEWFRETALAAAREHPADPMELVFAELWAVRHVLLNLFYAGAKATTEGAAMSPDSILKIRDRTDARKLEEARKMLGEFLAAEVGSSGGRT
jgi:hypothetical protein